MLLMVGVGWVLQHQGDHVVPSTALVMKQCWVRARAGPNAVGQTPSTSWAALLFPAQHCSSPHLIGIDMHIAKMNSVSNLRRSPGQANHTTKIGNISSVCQQSCLGTMFPDTHWTKQAKLVQTSPSKTII